MERKDISMQNYEKIPVVDKHNQNTFLERRREFENSHFQKGVSGIMDSIFVIDVSTSDLCNRTCVFRPRHNPEVYPNRNLHMTGEGAEVISKKIAEINFKGTIAISGFCENLLNPNILDIIQQFRKYNPDIWIECNTNGDPLTKEFIHDLFDRGLSCLHINLYDGPEQVPVFDEMIEGLDDVEQKIKYRVHWSQEDFGIIFNNRSGLVDWYGQEDASLDEVKDSPCYVPFYKLFIDWNGDVLFCANDWGRSRVVGNVLQQSIKEIWLCKELNKIRKRLAKGNRKHKPCNTCSVRGTLVGGNSFDMLVNYYETK